ncbi:hypothetical protein E3P99_03770 [Wallemia hederae]|uniref:Uncharacterized protein n=1 Tax=Wallemia hederae TaxID=1540922 RepID=A0A4T0FD87_9BASI|nr:hypothetical protein E3P99_03770 [Wallemia hederae]
MEIDIDLTYKPVSAPYNASIMSSPSSKRKRKLSACNTNSPRTIRRLSQQEAAQASAPLVNPNPPQFTQYLSHAAPDIIMATETLHMYDATMADSAALIKSDKKSSQRKVKFSMGPRADCPKCRLGVKGHYSHFD